MAFAYTKEFLVDAFVSRYKSLGTSATDKLRNMANEFYDTVGKDKFRSYCSLDADAIRIYKTSLK